MRIFLILALVATNLWQAQMYANRGHQLVAEQERSRKLQDAWLKTRGAAMSQGCTVPPLGLVSIR